MCKKSDFRAKQAAAAVGKAREESSIFPYETLLKHLKNYKCPYPVQTLAFLKREGLIEKNGDGLFFFPNPTPIYFGALRPELDRIAKNIKESLNRWQEKNGKLPKAKAIICEASKVDEMISHLKSLGYKILKPVQNFEEV